MEVSWPEQMVLRMSASKTAEFTGGSKTLHNEELNNF
jgi:hypothetical protein